MIGAGWIAGLTIFFLGVAIIANVVACVSFYIAGRHLRTARRVMTTPPPVEPKPPRTTRMTWHVHTFPDGHTGYEGAFDRDGNPKPRQANGGPASCPCDQCQALALSGQVPL